MADVILKNVHKVYDGGVHAVNDFNLEIKDKEFIVFVGPSGCGKSTTLRMIAGLEDISMGDIYIDDRLVNDVAPKDRDIAMVFQNYALYPHMTVYDNLAFGLKYHHYKKDEIKEIIAKVSEILEIQDLLKRKPKALSGGQKQRVALGRAIVRSPKVFLMDEPLSNLDAKLRVSMRSEITKIHRRVGTTTIYVTHDQTEAMTMADRIVIMNKGVIQQIGTPRELYSKPSNMFVASFIGAPAINFINGIFKDGKFNLLDCVIKLDLGSSINKQLKDKSNQEIVLAIRPEYISNKKVDDNFIAGIKVKVDNTELLGSQLIVYASLNEKKITMVVSENEHIDIDEEITIYFDKRKLLFFDAQTSLLID